MSDPNLKMRFFGDSADAERALVALEKKYEALQGQIKGATAASRRGSKTMSDQLGGAVVNAARAVAGYASIQAGISAVIRENERYIQSLERVNELLPEAETKLRIQGGLSPEEAKRTRGVVQQQLLRTPSATLVEGIDLQRQLISSGFNAADVNSGSALGAMLDLKAATNQFGGDMGDPMAAVLSISQFLKAQGRDANAANVRATGGKIAQIFEGSDIQFPDFGQLAQVSSTLTGLNVTENEQIAGFSTLVDVLGGNIAKTQFRSFGTRLRAAGDVPKAADAIRSLGLAPEDVDLIGESFTETLDRLGTAYSAADEKTRSSALLNIFGMEAASGAELLLSKRGLVRERMGALEGNAFDRGIGIFQESNPARDARFRVREDFATAEQLDRQGGVVRSTADQALNAFYAEERLKADGFFENASLMAGNLQARGNLWFDTTFMGRTPEQSLEALSGRGNDFGTEALKELRKIAGNTQPALNRNPQGE